MQMPDGDMRMLEQEEIKEKLYHPKVSRKNQYFKINQCYFKITEITTEGITAKGISRREYFDNRR